MENLAEEGLPSLKVMSPSIDWRVQEVEKKIKMEPKIHLKQKHVQEVDLGVPGSMPQEGTDSSMGRKWVDIKKGLETMCLNGVGMSISLVIPGHRME